MQHTLPKFSRITYKRRKGNTLISIPYPEANMLIYLLGVLAFISVFAWWFGVIEGFMYLTDHLTITAVLLYLLWIIAGIVLVLAFVRGSRPSQPQEIILTDSGWSICTGIPSFPPLNTRHSSQRTSFISTIPYKKRYYYLNNEQCRALVLDKQNGNLCLLIEVDGDVLRLGDWLPEQEKQWLYQTLKKGYYTISPSVMLFSFKESSR